MAAGTQGRRGTGSHRRLSILSLAAALAACAGGSSGTDAPVAVPTISLQPDGDHWSSAPTSDRLTKVSNNGLGYTGEIDRYELGVPATGRLQISLSWNHAANFDLIVATDDLGHLRVAEGLEDGSEPEYVGFDVALGQKLFLFVAGWTGDPGPYLLETVLLPPTTPLFAMAEIPDFDEPWPSDAPMTFTFTTDLDPDQDLDGRIYLVHPGGVTEGTWCIDGPRLTFHPHLPGTAGDTRGLLPGAPHVLQFRRAALGVRASSGEYLTDLVGVGFAVAAPADLWPAAPQVTGITPAPAAEYHGEAITIAFSEPLDPATVSVGLVSVWPGGSTQPLPFDFDLRQTWLCSGEVEVRLLVAPRVAPPAGTVTRLTLPGTIRALGGGVVFLPVTVDFPPP
jgi:hypothetical protein